LINTDFWKESIMPKISKQDRRRFLGKLVAFTAAPMIIPGSSLGLNGTVSPSNRITLGLIGCGGHGAGWNLDQIFRNKDSQVIAVCDVDNDRCQKAKGKVDAHYSRLYEKEFRACSSYKDFRDLIRRTDIDAVVNCTPDHWHVIPSIMAVKTGKDVICEKPLTLTIDEGKILCKVLSESDRIFQTASENRSIDRYLKICEAVRNRVIGQLKHIEVSLPSGNEARGENFSDRDERPVPDAFDYEMWLGQAPLAPYVPARCHGSFRWIMDYSGGRLTDWGAHMIDLAQIGNDSEKTGPVEVSGSGKFPPQGELFNTAYEFDLHYRYENGVTMDVVSQGPGIRFEGSDGWIGFKEWRGELKASSPEFLRYEVGSGREKLYYPSEIVKVDDHWKGGEHRNFIDCVKSRKPCYAPAEIGHRTITIAHIGNIAMLLGRKLHWDPVQEEFEDDPEANRMLSRSQRTPWTIENIDDWIS
jgi:predicted dehydrogenase